MNKKSQVKSSRSKKKPNIDKELTKNVSLKNYSYAILVFFGIILVVLYIFEWVNVKKDERLMNSYLLTSNTIDSKIEDLASLKQIMQEVPSSYFIYFGYTNDEDVYDLEVSLKKVIDKYELSDNFYYFDVTKMKEDNENYITEINNSLEIDMERTPAIIYVVDGEIKSSNILDGVSDTMLKVADLENLLDIYEYEAVK